VPYPESVTDDDSTLGVGEVPEVGVLNALADATDDVLWLCTADWEQVVFVNDAYEDVFGQSVDALTADPTAFVDSVHPDDREDVREAMTAVSEGNSRELEVRVTRGEAADRWIQIRARPVTDGSEVTHVAGFSRDVTERKRRERELERLRTELERSNEDLQQFAYVVSHDLKEPLRMVSSYMDLLESEYAEDLDAEAAEYVEFAADGAERMTALIDGLLRFSRVETRGEEMRPVDAEAVVEDAKGALAMRIEEASATIDVESLPTVPADRAQLSQVFRHLISNAIEYAGPDPPTIVVRTEGGDDEVVFAVEDDGVGVPEDEQDDIFGIFERGADASGDGIGIGLAICRRIVERHGGEMWVDSGEGEGTTMYFSLSRDPDPGRT
jgi:PAS domain S-box-containing protein